MSYLVWVEFPSCMKYPTCTYAPGANGLIKIYYQARPNNCRTCCYSLMGPPVTVEAQLAGGSAWYLQYARWPSSQRRVQTWPGLAPLFSCFISVCTEYCISGCTISLCETEWALVLSDVFYILYAHKDNPYIFSCFKKGGTFSNQASEICWLAWRILCQKAGECSVTLLACRLMCARVLWWA